MTEELTEGKNEEQLSATKSNNEDFPMAEWHVEGPFICDPHNNIVCKCYQLGCLDQEYGIAWARRNASEIAFLHNVRLEKDKIISRAKPIGKESEK